MADVKLSKRMAHALRHAPESYGLALDPNGWVEVEELATALHASTSQILEVVDEDEKKRYTVQDTRIRAAQGHSVPVDLDLPPVQPPEFLYHGTVASAIPGVRTYGLLPQSRQQVHLSERVATAYDVGARRGKPLVLIIRAQSAWYRGAKFFLADNGVWLTDRVPPEYVLFP